MIFGNPAMLLLPSFFIRQRTNVKTDVKDLKKDLKTDVKDLKKDLIANQGLSEIQAEIICAVIESEWIT